VTAFVRDSAKANFPSSVRRVQGDVLDAGTVRTALTGQDAVICALGSSASGPFKTMTLMSQGTQHLVDAMRGEAVNRLVCITGVGAGDSIGHGPWYYNWLIQPLMLRGVYEDKTRQEAIVRGSGLAWTLVRPAILTNGAAKGRAAVRALTQLSGIHVGKISRADVAGFCLRELADRRFLSQAPVISY